MQSLKSCPAIVLAGGFGTRLRSAYNSGPKCMAPVGKHLFLEYPLLWLRSAGIQDVVMCIGYKGFQLRDWLGDGSRWGVNITYSSEESPLGTGGALKLAEKFISADRFFVLNGDSFLAVDLANMYCYHTSHRTLGTIAVIRQPCSERYGSVEMAPDGSINAFREKKSEPQGTSQGNQFINGGVYLFQKRFLEAIPVGQAVSLENEIFPTFGEAGLHGFPTNGYFIDIGVPADLERAGNELPEKFTL